MRKKVVNAIRNARVTGAPSTPETRAKLRTFLEFWRELAAKKDKENENAKHSNDNGNSNIHHT